MAALRTSAAGIRTRRSKRTRSVGCRPDPAHERAVSGVGQERENEAYSVKVDYGSLEATITEPQQTWVKPFYPAFNGLRAIAILLVFLRHYGVFVVRWKIFYAGWIGVDLFFVLSGFLITGILYDTRHDSGYFRTFFIRRALRLLPLLYGFFGLVLLLMWPLHLEVSPYVFTYPLYVANLVTPFLDLARHNVSRVTWHLSERVYMIRLDHLWSLCVEEQFYLVWPFVIWLVRSRVRLMKWCVAGALIALLTRTLLLLYAPRSFVESSAIYYFTPTRCDPLFIGSWFALWVRGGTFSPEVLRRTAQWLFWASSLVLSAGAMLTIDRWPYCYSNPFLATVGFSLIATMFAGILLYSLDEKSFIYQLATLPGLTKLGIVSYGFYFFHELLEPEFAWRAERLAKHHLLLPGVIVTFCGAFAMASLSFRFYETPFLRLKQRLAPTRQVAPSR